MPGAADPRHVGLRRVTGRADDRAALGLKLGSSLRESDDLSCRWWATSQLDAREREQAPLLASFYEANET